MNENTNIDGGTLYSVTFLTNNGASFDRLVLVKQAMTTEEIKVLVLAKFQSIDKITHVDEWQPVIILDN